MSFGAQSFYIRILTLVDDFGRFDGRVPVLHGQCFALRNDVTPQDTAGYRSELHEAGLIEVYVVEKKDYIQVSKWQERTRSEKSKFPDPPRNTESQESAAERSGTQGKDASLVLSHRPSSIAITSKPPPLPNGNREGGLSKGQRLSEIHDVAKTALSGTGLAEIKKRLNAIFKRPALKAFSHAEERALMEIPTDEDELVLIERYYALPHPAGEKDFRRTALHTLLENWNGEVDRARAALGEKKGAQPTKEEMEASWK